MLQSSLVLMDLIKTLLLTDWYFSQMCWMKYNSVYLISRIPASKSKTVLLMETNNRYDYVAKDVTLNWENSQCIIFCPTVAYEKNSHVLCISVCICAYKKQLSLYSFCTARLPFSCAGKAKAKLLCNYVPLLELESSVVSQTKSHNKWDK